MSYSGRPNRGRVVREPENKINWDNSGLEPKHSNSSYQTSGGGGYNQSSTNQSCYEPDWDDEDCDLFKDKGTQQTQDASHSSQNQSSWYDNSSSGDQSRNGRGYNHRQSNRSDGSERQNPYNRSENDNQWRNHSGQQDDGNSSTFTIKSSDVGHVIGKGGCMIRELQEKSSARIKVDRDADGSDNTVRLSGSSEAQAKAKELIVELIESIEEKEIEKMRRRMPTSTIFANKNDKKEEHGQIDWSAVFAEGKAYEENRWNEFPSIRKSFYNEATEVFEMTDEQVDRFRIENNNIVVQALGGDQDIPNPITDFHQVFSDFPEIMEQIRNQGFKKPSPIQCQAWPIVMQGRDLIGIAQTGTGKTIAFLLPALIHIEHQEIPRDQRCGPTVIIMAPTRELAIQISREASKYSYKGIKSLCVYGGGDRKSQIKLVGQGVEIVIATPGRLNDLVMNHHISLNSVSFLVLDEADRMLDMGFEPQIKKIMLDIRPDRQVVMTSATWPPSVRQLSESYTKDPVITFIGSLDLTACHSVRQTIEIVDESEKHDMAYEFIRQMGPNDKAIIFVGRKAIADHLSSDMALDGFNVQSLHGDREQADREQALNDLRTGNVRVLVATDLASRGLDVPDISHIYNYDFPRHVEEYVHRIGRTGRAGRTGESISLFTRQDWKLSGELIKILEEADQEVPSELYAMHDRFQAWKKKEDGLAPRSGGRGRGGGRGRRGGGNRSDDWFC